MGVLEEEYKPVLKEIHDEWKKSELTIKQAEQVNNAVVVPAIKELRYAGRRIVDALYLIATDGDKKKVLEFLLDAKFDCNRARHDAVDAAISKIAIDLDTLVRRTGPVLIMKTVPEYRDLVKLLQEVRNKIAQSRGGRENRDQIYSNIEQQYLDKIIELYNTVKSSDSMLYGVAKREILRRKIAYLIGITGLIIAIFSVLSNR